MFEVGTEPQHVVPSWDLKTLWVTNNGDRRSGGSLTAIDPLTGKRGEDVEVDDPYDTYFTPDGRAAIIVAENRKRLDFRDPQTMALQGSLETPGCPGVNHADFSNDGHYAIFTCEFEEGGLVKIDLVTRQVLGYLALAKGSMPQDIRISPDGKSSSSLICIMTACSSWTGSTSLKSGSSQPGGDTWPLSEPRCAKALCCKPRVA